MLTVDDLHLKLLANSPIEIDSVGFIQMPTIREIISMSENTYQTSMSYLLFNKKSLPEVNEELDKVSDFELTMNYLYHDNSFKELFFYGLNMIFNDKPIQHDSGLVYFGEPEDERIITDESLKYIQQVVKIANWYEEKQEEEFTPGNERARKFMEKLKLKKAQAPKVKPKQSLHSIISAVGWKSTRGLDEILDLTIYQLYNGLRTLNNIDNYHYTLTGIYTGTIDSKGIKLPDIHWANIIK